MIPVVFDLDGTLIHSAPDIHLGVNKALEGRGLAPLSLAEVVSFIGNGLPKLAERVMVARDLDLSGHGAFHAELAAAYDSVNGTLTDYYAGVRDTLTALAGAGHPLGLCTNKPMGPTQDLLAHFGLTDVFGVVVGGDSLTTRKPEPAMLDACFDALGGTGVYVGDSEVDAETAQRAGVPFLLFTGGYRKTPVEALYHSRAFDDWPDVPKLVADVAVQA